MAWQDKPIEAIGGGILSYFDELKDMLGKKKKGIKVGEGVMDATTGVKSAFEQKMQWLQNNPNATEQELGILGIGSTGLNTPAERDWLKNVMSGASFGMNNEAASVIQDKVKYVSEALKRMGVQEGSPQFREMLFKAMSGVGMSNEAAKVIQDKVKGYGNYISELDIGSRGLNTAAERDVLANTMGKGTTLGSDVFPMIKELGIGARGLDTPAEREFIMKQQAFEAELTKLSSADLSSVLELFQGLSPQEKDTYMNHVIENGFNYGTINESAPLRTQGFQQYNTGTGNLQNLGFGY